MFPLYRPDTCFLLFYFDPVLSTQYGNKRWRKWDGRTKLLKFVQTDEKL